MRGITIFVYQALLTALDVLADREILALHKRRIANQAKDRFGNQYHKATRIHLCDAGKSSETHPQAVCYYAAQDDQCHWQDACGVYESWLWPGRT